MRYIFICFIMAGLFLFTQSCSNDFELVEQGPDIPVVYGLLSAQDTANYFRVEKAFIDPNIGGDVLAKDPKNLYFDDIVVKLKNVKTNKEYTLKRVDGNLEGYQRKGNGAFASAPNFLYKIKRSELNLLPKEEYKLIVSRTDGAILTEANTKVLTPLIDDRDVEPKSTTLLSFGYNSNFRLSWFPDENSVIHDVILIINYSEILNGVTSQKSIPWKVAENFVESQGANQYTLLKSGRGFYEFLAGALTPSGPNNPVKRVFKDISVNIISGGQPIKDLIRIGQVNLGITSSGEIPVYSNMSNGGRGIFSAKTEFIRNGMGMAKPSLDSLRTGTITKSLNFQ